MNVLNLKAMPGNLDRLIEFIDKSLSPHDFPSQTVSKAKIACEEIFINICSYAYVPDSGNVQIRSWSVPDSVLIEFEDAGRPFNPLSEDRLKNKTSADELTEGGHGILMARNLVSEMSYRFLDGKNILTMVLKKG